VRLPELERVLVDGARRQEQAAHRIGMARPRGRTLAVALVCVLLGLSAARSLVSIAPAPSRAPSSPALATPRPARLAQAAPVPRGSDGFLREIAMVDPLSGCLSVAVSSATAC
jgi:hypothetical protein